MQRYELSSIKEHLFNIFSEKGILGILFALFAVPTIADDKVLLAKVTESVYEHEKETLTKSLQRTLDRYKAYLEELETAEDALDVYIKYIKGIGDDIIEGTKYIDGQHPICCVDNWAVDLPQEIKKIAGFPQVAQDLYNTFMASYCIRSDYELWNRVVTEGLRTDTILLVEAIEHMKFACIENEMIRKELEKYRDEMVWCIKNGVDKWTEERNPNTSAFGLEQLLLMEFLKNKECDGQFVDELLDAKVLDVDSIIQKTYLDNWQSTLSWLENMIETEDFNKRCELALIGDFRLISDEEFWFLEVATSLMNSGEYSPLLPRVWERWRSICQREFGGFSSTSHVYTNLYNQYRNKVFVSTVRHIATHKNDSFAIGVAQHLMLLENSVEFILGYNTSEYPWEDTQFYITDSPQSLLNYETETLERVEKECGKESIAYAASLSEIARYYQEVGNYEQAICLFMKAQDLNEKLLGEDHIEYVTNICNIATCYCKIEKHSQAITFFKDAMNIEERLLLKEHPDFAQTLNDLACCYRHIGDYEQAIRLHTKAKEIRERILGKADLAYAQSLNNLAICYCEQGYYGLAIVFNEEAKEIRANILGQEHPDYIGSLNNIANSYFYLGNYKKALKLYTEVKEVRERLLPKGDFLNYASILNNLAGCYSKLGNHELVLPLYEEALTIQEYVLGKEHPDYLTSKFNLANHYYIIGNLEEATKILKEVQETEEMYLESEQLHYVQTLNNLALCYIHSKNYEQSVILSEEALKILEKNWGIEHPDCSICLKNLAICSRKYNNIELFISYFCKYVTNKMFMILNNSEIGIENRQYFWKKNKHTFEDECQYYSFAHKDNQLIHCSFNSSLFSKGFLLGSELETRNIINLSNDSELLALYDSFAGHKRMLAKLYEKPIKERYIDTDSLEEVTDKIERELMYRSKEYAGLSHNMRIQMEDVKEKLGSGDVALEFQSFPMLESESDSIMYTALVLKKHYESPHLIPLFEEKQLSSIPTDQLYATDSLYNLVWKPLEEELKGFKNVYFSPSGMLYNTNIEVLPQAVGKLSGANFYRLSSTRQLAYIKDGIEGDGAAIFGGLAYDLDEDKMQEERNKIERTPKERSFTDFDLRADSIDIRGGMHDLPYTRDEVDAIHATMKKEEITPSILLYTGAEGIEENFKALDGKRKKIIHLSTHGFYYKEDEAEKMKKIGLKPLDLMDDNRPRYVEDKQLTRSGLMMSGCNNVLKGKNVPEGADDGILYAKEIASMDLRGLDLVSLSACQTGLGDISGEGVFGLQRAFKKAGAQSILMSLWKVDDAATMLFMTRFYENYLSKKMTKVESLYDAQEYLRQKGYTNPKDWAAFILLDAI